MSDYLEKLSRGTLSQRLRTHADEYLGPCGQGVTIQQANQIKRETLLEAANEIERLLALLEPCKPDTDSQDPQAGYPKTVNDVLSLLSAYIADLLPEEMIPGDEYFASWERHARPVIEKIIKERDEARSAARLILMEFPCQSPREFSGYVKDVKRRWPWLEEVGDE